MNVLGLFPTPFALLKLNCDPRTYVDYAQNLEHIEPQGVRPGGWQSDFLDLTQEVVAPLVAQIQQCCDGLASELWQLTQRLEVTQGWINSNRSADQLANNWNHLHPGVFMSFVYYAHAPQHSGDLVLEPPHSWNDYCVPENDLAQLNLWNAQRHHYTPSTGDLVAFPGWIKHSARPNQSGEQRISYAFNAQLKPLNS